MANARIARLDLRNQGFTVLGKDGKEICGREHSSFDGYFCIEEPGHDGMCVCSSAPITVKR